MHLDKLIYGDYLIFTMGNLIADSSIALFALLSWKSQELKNEINHFILSIEKKQILTDRQIFRVKSVFLRPDQIGLNKKNLPSEVISDIENYLSLHKKYNRYNKYVIYLFIIGVFIQLSGILSARVISYLSPCL